MNKVLLIQLDGKLPNVALMRLAFHFRAMGHHVELRRNPDRLLWDDFDAVYASTIFKWSSPIVSRLLRSWPNAVIGGTGIDDESNIEALGVFTNQQDYSDYPSFTASIGFTQRGCRLKCKFCVVPTKEGVVRKVGGIWDVWRGDPYPRHLHLLDNDFFGQPGWEKHIEDIRDGGFKVCWNQGFNVRLIGDEEAAAIATVRYYDDQFKTPRLYTAWDNKKDEKRLFANLNALVRYGVKPDHIMVYMLIGYWDGPQITADDLYREQQLREFGCRPYPMPYVRNRETVGFQRWVVGAYSKRIAWEAWERASYDPRKLGVTTKANP